MRLILAFWSAKPIWRPKKPKLMFHRPAKPCRGFSIAALPLVAAGAARVSRGLCRAVEEGASAVGWVYECVQESGPSSEEDGRAQTAVLCLLLSQIGRAACRERVCRSVKIAGGAVS